MPEGRFLGALIEIENGSLADSEIVNGNFEYLDGRITSVGSSITTLQSNLATLNSTLSSAINSSKTDILQTLYPVGSIYIGTQSTCPLAALFGTWSKIAGDKVLQSSSSSHAANTTIAAGLPNLVGDSKCIRGLSDKTPQAPFYVTSDTSWVGHDGGVTKNTIGFDASKENSIYGNSSTVQPPAYVVNVWRRTA